MNKKTKETITNLPTFWDWQKEYFKKNPKEIAQYKKYVVKSYNENPDIPMEVFIHLMRNIAELEGFSKVAQRTKLGRESLYKALSPKGNPTYNTLAKVADACGFRIGLLPK
jgi:probable addiction module antidote protein